MMNDRPIVARTSLIDFPCDFPIKVIGAHSDSLVNDLTTIAQRFDPSFNPRRIELRASKKSHYLGVTLMVRAINQARLDDLYRALCQHPGVKVVL